MAWYKSGSVNVTNGNATVYGNGTLWIDVSILYPGDVWVGPDGRLYEIASIQSNTQITLASAYLGATANAQSYAIMPIGLLPSALAQQVKATLSTANTALSQAVRFDANQNLTSGQKATARSNIGATAAADVGAGLLSKSVAGGIDVTLSTDEAANLFYEFSGALTANINVVVPGNVRQFFVRNYTSGAYTLTVKTQAGTGVKVLQGTRVHLECDGTNVIEPTSKGSAITADASGNVGFGASAVFNPGYTGVQIHSTGPGSQLRLTNPTTGATSMSGLGISVDVAAGYVWNFSNMPLIFGTNNVECGRIDTSKKWGIGTTSPISRLHVNDSTASACYATVGNVNNGVLLGVNAIGTAQLLAYNGQAIDFGSYNAGSPTLLMRLDGTGNLLMGVASSQSIGKFQIGMSDVEGTPIMGAVKNGVAQAFGFFLAGAQGYNAAACVQVVAKNTTTSRSINAGGTINASGADYAEYMAKAESCGTLLKGQIVGVDVSGKLTDKWEDAVSFLVKSTDPSYVGGDVWGTEAALGMQRPVEPAFVAPVYTGSYKPDDLLDGEASWTDRDAALAQYEADQAAYADAVEASRSHFDTVTMPAYRAALAVFEAKLEAERQKVDRIAYCGQVPVNVHGAKPGQFVVPVQDGDGIGGQLVDDDAITFAQYRRAVGVVQNILADGRANIRVKVV